MQEKGNKEGITLKWFLGPAVPPSLQETSIGDRSGMAFLFMGFYSLAPRDLFSSEFVGWWPLHLDMGY